MHKKEKDSSKFNLTTMENTNLPISSTRKYFRSTRHGDQPLGEEMKFLRQDDKEHLEHAEGRGLQHSQGRDRETDVHFSCKHFTVNSSASAGNEMVPHWAYVPVTDTDEDRSYLAACLYSKKGNAAQVSFLFRK